MERDVNSKSQQARKKSAVGCSFIDRLPRWSEQLAARIVSAGKMTVLHTKDVFPAYVCLFISNRNRNPTTLFPIVTEIKGNFFASQSARQRTVYSTNCTSKHFHLQLLFLVFPSIWYLNCIFLQFKCLMSANS